MGVFYNNRFSFLTWCFANPDYFFAEIDGTFAGAKAYKRLEKSLLGLPLGFWRGTIQTVSVLLSIALILLIVNIFK